MGARRLAATTRRSNKSMQRLLPRLGFEFEGVARRFFGPRRGDDGLRFVLFPEQAGKWLRQAAVAGQGSLPAARMLPEMPDSLPVPG
jgi:hypothetical protein